MRLDWGRFHLISRKEKEVIRLLNEHIQMVQRTVEGLTDVVKAARACDWATVELKAELMAKYEALADDAHREAVVEISQGAFFAGMREDFLDLLEQMDEIADAGMNAARIMAQSPLEGGEFKVLYGEPGPSIEDFVARVTSTVGLLGESVNALQADTNVAVEKALSIEKIEEEADDAKANLIKKLYSRKGSLDVLSLLQLRDFVLKLDEVADAAEDSSDLVISMVAKATA